MRTPHARGAWFDLEVMWIHTHTIYEPTLDQKKCPHFSPSTSVAHALLNSKYVYLCMRYFTQVMQVQWASPTPNTNKTNYIQTLNCIAVVQTKQTCHEIIHHVL